MLYRGVLYNRRTTDSRFVPPHRVVEPHAACIEVRIGLADVGVAEHLLDVVDRPTDFEPSRSSLMTQVVEVQIDGASHP